MSIDYKNLNEEDLKLIDKWLGEYDPKLIFPSKMKREFLNFLIK